MRTQDVKPAVIVLAGLGALGGLLTLLSFVSMRMARHQAYAEFAAHCARISVLTLEDARYFCAPVARIERPPPDPDGQAVTRL